MALGFFVYDDDDVEPVLCSFSGFSWYGNWRILTIVGFTSILLRFGPWHWRVSGLGVWGSGGLGA